MGGELGGKRRCVRSVMMVSRARGGLNRINQVTVHHYVLYPLGKIVRFLYSCFARNAIWLTVEYMREIIISIDIFIRKLLL